MAGPAVATSDIGSIDAVLLTHDHNDDNLDPAGPRAAPGGRRGRHDGLRSAASSQPRAIVAARRPRAGLEPWQTTRLEAPGRPPIEVTATPCLHGPPPSHPLVGSGRLLGAM